MPCVLAFQVLVCLSQVHGTPCDALNSYSEAHFFLDEVLFPPLLDEGESTSTLSMTQVGLSVDLFPNLSPLELMTKVNLHLTMIILPKNKKHVNLLSIPPTLESIEFSLLELVVYP